MKQNKKGFTLIELLGVIIILAIITLIATPIIMGVIDDAKKNSAVDSMYMYVKAVELAVNVDSKISGLIDGTYTTKDGDLYTGSTLVLDVQTKGTKPENGGTVKMVKGDLEEARLSISGYIIIYKNKKATVEGADNTPPTPPDKIYSIGDEVFFNPVTGVKCTKGQEWTFSNTSSNCYKWNVMTVNGNKLELLANHNIILNPPYNDNNQSGPSVELWNKITSITGAWKNIDVFTESDSVELAGYNTSYKINYAGKKVKVPSTSLIISLVGATDVWNPGLGATDSSISLSKKSFLYQNLTSNEDGTYCYWTDQAATYDNLAMWVVDVDKNLYNDYWARSNQKFCGFRPIIRLDKTNL